MVVDVDIMMWDLAPCVLVDWCHCFGITSCLHHQGRRVSCVGENAIDTANGGLGLER